MYENYYRFSEKPFSLTPDPKFLFLSKHHQEAMGHMLFGVKQREGFMAIIGDVGTGKTTLCRCLLDRLNDDVKVALILNPMLSDMDLLRTCVHDLGVKPTHAYSMETVPLDTFFEGEFVEPDSHPLPTHVETLDMEWVNQASKKELIDALNIFLLAQHDMGGSTVLIIDEAQNLSLEVMEQLRILSNLETEKEKLLQIIFVGQLELNDKLKSPELKQLNQRISIRYEIIPLSKQETVQYINHRIMVAGVGSRIWFKPSALKEIYKYSLGYPRLINLVCDRALLSGYNQQVDAIDRAQVNQGIKSLMGEEDKDYGRDYFIRFRLPLIAGVLFFLSGLVFFMTAQMDIKWNSGGKRLFSSLGITRTSTIKSEFAGDSTQRESTQLRETTPLAIVPEAKTPESNSVISPVENLVAKNQKSSKESENISGPNKSIKTKASAGGEKNYSIQLYSFPKEPRAREEVEKLREEGYNGYWKKAVTQDQDWYMVYVGPYREAQSARIHVNALKFSGRNPILLSVAKSR